MRTFYNIWTFEPKENGEKVLFIIYGERTWESCVRERELFHKKKDRRWFHKILKNLEIRDSLMSVLDRHWGLIQRTYDVSWKSILKVLFFFHLYVPNSGTNIKSMICCSAYQRTYNHEKLTLHVLPNFWGTNSIIKKLNDKKAKKII